jgi:hypothetical protein
LYSQQLNSLIVPFGALVTGADIYGYPAQRRWHPEQLFVTRLLFIGR